MPLKTTQLYDYEHLLLVIGADAASGQTPPPTLIIVKNAIKDGEGQSPQIIVWKSTESFQ